jgi:hypothetical protein
VQELEMLAQNLGSDDWLEQARTHLERCGSCRAEMALYQSFENAEPGAAEQEDLQWVLSQVRSPWEVQQDTAGDVPSRVAPQREPWWRRWFRWRSPVPALAMVAAALALFAVISVLRQSSSALLPDGTEESRIIRSGQLRLLAPAGQVEAVPEVLLWEPHPGALRYQVKLMAVDGEVLWQAETQASSATLPQAQREAVLPGRSLRWSVTAVGANGAALTPPSEQEFRLRHE